MTSTGPIQHVVIIAAAPTPAFGVSVHTLKHHHIPPTWLALCCRSTPLFGDPAGICPAEGAGSLEAFKVRRLRERIVPTKRGCTGCLLSKRTPNRSSLCWVGAMYM